MIIENADFPECRTDRAPRVQNFVCFREWKGTNASAEKKIRLCSKDKFQNKVKKGVDGRKGPQSHGRISLNKLLVTTHMYFLCREECTSKSPRQGWNHGLVIKLQLSCSRPFIERPDSEAKFLNL
jgi:hypothetical protein